MCNKMALFTHSWLGVCEKRGIYAQDLPLLPVPVRLGMSKKAVGNITLHICFLVIIS